MYPTAREGEPDPAPKRPAQPAPPANLEVRLATERVGLVYRTPGDDVPLALGFLFAAGLIHSVDEVGAAHHCGQTHDGYGNLVEVTPAAGAHQVLRRLDASALTGAAGRGARPVRAARPPQPTLDDGVLRGAAQALEREATRRGLVAGEPRAAVLSLTGRVLAFASDVRAVGAVDKAVGGLLLARALPLTGGGPDEPAVLVASGAGEVELVQRALMAGLRAVVCLKAASAAARALADREGLLVAQVTEVGVDRGGGSETPVTVGELTVP